MFALAQPPIPDMGAALAPAGNMMQAAAVSRTLLSLPGGATIPLLSWLFTARCCHVSPPIAEP
jgi:hypothetical protein